MEKFMNVGPGNNDYGRTKGPYNVPDLKSSPGIITRKWEVVSFVGNSTEPEVIKRLRDGETFAIGNYVTNGTKMKGTIERFDYSFKSDEVFVYTDWSGVGMNLDSLHHTTKLPSAHQIGHKVKLEFGEEGTLKDCEIIKVHFSESKVLYDVEVSGMYDKAYQKKGDPQKWTTRLYNVDSCFVSALTS